MYAYSEEDNTIDYPPYSDEQYWKYLLKEAKWYAEQESMENSSCQDRENVTFMRPDKRMV